MRKLILKLVLTLMLTLMTAPLAYAASPVNCQQLNDPAATKNYVIAIIEEQIGSAKDAPEGTNVIDCFRETNCKPEKVPAEGTQEAKEVTKCTSEYKESCSPSDTIFCQRVQAFISQSGLDLLFTYIGLIYRWSAGVIGIVSVFYLVYGGIKIASAGDNQAALDDAKAKIAQSLAGLVLLFLSAIILYTINPNFFVL